ncbi:dephospho-CoA kinase [Colwellia sp. 1_MG-2023]|uniref:dephospho-CoA kinase n=1 Tax=Colwellia sp. 1_MG-2023 TaxID=3062649 RepID=UPI0026E41A07|nr:dephospho-CoA kinase [Colwellia sp. 1_MG-2023]MDO6444666.1 dephospho-CoA kinase [Colwellia sp. 1_MG-2023]
MAKYIVGLTGGIGSGKTTVSNMFAELGVEIIDADIIAREVVAPNSLALKEIAQHFGQEILLTNGELDRSALRSKVFADDEDKRWLNALLHPLIRQSILMALSQAAGQYCILSAPLLLENNLHVLVNTVLVVDVSVETQLKRTCLRDKSNQQEVNAIINSQINRDQRLALADDIINNERADLAYVREQVISLNARYQSQASAVNS